MKRPLCPRLKSGAGRSIRFCRVWYWVLPEYRNLLPNRGKNPAFVGGSGSFNLHTTLDFFILYFCVTFCLKLDFVKFITLTDSILAKLVHFTCNILQYNNILFIKAYANHQLPISFNTDSVGCTSINGKIAYKVINYFHFIR